MESAHPVWGSSSEAEGGLAWPGWGKRGPGAEGGQTHPWMKGLEFHQKGVAVSGIDLGAKPLGFKSQICYVLTL